MVKIAVYLVAIAVADLYAIASIRILQTPLISDLSLIGQCFFVGGLGGVIYCLRGIYLNACVRNDWDAKWSPWYYIRPIVSHLCGVISYVFLRAGLILLEAEKSSGSSDLGFLALAFIAGLNVDKFLSKIEEIAQATWGIEKSRTASKEGKDGA
jgi:hypothetical protein